MCGFAGFLDYRKRSTRGDLIKMISVLSHRGPDADGVFIDENNEFTIGLGHRRLSIIDLQIDSNQPMMYNDWIIVFNGEIYNYQEIRRKLKTLGHEFKTKSDTEVILHAFDEWGESSINKFIGMFSFILYNKSTQDVYTVRDRAGVKPFFIYNDGEIIMWASEIKSFHEHPSFSKNINLNSVKAFVQLGYVPSPYSIFCNVSKHAPGTICTLNKSKKSFNENKYWNLLDYYKKPKLDIAYGEAKSEVKKLLSSACNYRTVSDVPLGIFLSGGYDSTFVASSLQCNSSSKINTFTIGVKDDKINEANYAKEIAKILGTAHHEDYIENYNLEELINLVPYYCDEPFGDPSIIPTMLVSDLAKKNVTVALSADGGDEVFGGYNRYNYLSKLSIIRNVPFRDSIFNYLINYLINDPLQSHRLKIILKNPTSMNLSRILINPYFEDEVEDLFVKKIDNNIISNLGANINLFDDLDSMMAFDYENYLLNDILVKVDRATMYASLEGREPLLDHRLVEFVAQLPNNYKIKQGNKKFILKDIVHDYIPIEIMSRPKMGFAPPLKKWLYNDLSPQLDYYLSKDFVIKQDIFEYENLLKIRTEFLNNRKYPMKLWYILMFQMWYHRWIT